MDDRVDTSDWLTTAQQAPAESRWQRQGRWLAALGVIAAFGYFAFIKGTRIPLLGWADLGFHELGHMLFLWAGEFVHFIAGSAMQVAVPFGLAVYFGVFRKDRLAAAICLAWAAASTQDVSVYIADAPTQELQLIGGEHDWAYLLGPEQLDMLGSAATVATAVWTAGLVMWLGAVWLAARPLLPGWVDPAAARRAQRAALTPSWAQAAMQRHDAEATTDKPAWDELRDAGWSLPTRHGD